MPRVTKREHIRRMVDAVKGPLRLQDWIIEVQVQRMSAKDGKAGCVAKPEYKEATLYFDLRRIPLADLWPFVLHEMLHIHIWKLAAVGERLAGTDTKHLEAVNWEEEALATELERLLTPLLEPYVRPILEELQ